jgi:hypothetical protein
MTPMSSLKGVSKIIESVSAGRTPPTREKKIYSPDNFPLKQSFFKEFMQRHSGIQEFLGEGIIQNFYQMVDQKFFIWLNYRKNSEKMVYEIKREFMCIAEAVLLQEVTNQQRNLTPFGFVVGPLQKMLESFAEDEKQTSVFVPIKFDVITYSRPLQRHPLISDIEDIELENDSDIAVIDNMIDISDFFLQ